MITEVRSDIIDFAERFHADCNKGKNMAIIHQANCFNTLANARGIARTLAEYCPALADADLSTIKGDANKLGRFTYARKYDDVYIFNAYGQYQYGNSNRTGLVYTDYKKLKQAIIDVRDYCFGHLQNPVFVLPKYIGAGLANGDHKTIMNKIIIPAFDSNDIECYLLAID